MWVSRLILGSVLIIARGQCQKTICDIDPELLFFDDEELEKLKNSFQAGGACSPFDLKGELENSLQTQGKEVRDLSSRDRTVLEYLSSFEQTRSEDSPSPDFYFYLGNQKRPKRPYQFQVNNDRGIPSREQSSPNEHQKLAHSNLPTSQQKVQFSRLVRPAWDQVVDEVWFNDQSPQINNVKMNPEQIRVNLQQPTNSNHLLTQSLFGNSGNRFSPQSVSPNQRFPSGKNKPGLFTPRQNQPFLFDQGRRPTSQENDIVMPNSMPESTTLPGPPTWATPPSPCVRRCPNTPEYNPVCGTDRVTYRNPGRLRCERQCGKGGVSINHYGNCVLTTADPLIPATTPTPTLATRPPRLRPSPSTRFRDYN